MQKKLKKSKICRNSVEIIRDVRIRLTIDKSGKAYPEDRSLWHY